MCFGAMSVFHTDKGIVVAPTVEKTEPYGLEIVIGIEVPL